VAIQTSNIVRARKQSRRLHISRGYWTDNGRSKNILGPIYTWRTLTGAVARQLFLERGTRPRAPKSGTRNKGLRWNWSVFCPKNGSGLRGGKSRPGGPKYFQGWQLPPYFPRLCTGVSWITTELNTLGQKLFGNVTKALSRNYTKRNVFRLCLFCEKLRFIHFVQRTSVKSNKS